ncbi:bifunctional [glutamine synthetase] adenylyltransferase/[glutamine synthetase]-adenylyl-L-tyrosine phosphorylase [Georgenia satyanarayanai]|uniref:bifunctional [glutamine synthetase] adenylyltransferase/[glutamine synthetase]-adenylyl-L-tyrosine phosphorylase n=1 Tax=Georgenia satyanarayanai TaxID=860221 RepID=UPI00203AC52A|nr:bifunctional [glutamine synthetase] adenylyltransferase/[glutamine synthetase]-adenylyl-L-tyrosine phosphorylase [Georgenia satyanarayanai]MCM3662138.1 bifunctional [glutamine synthetase] adenylyltransferase/[glutamine synthetase]-adenylyl-L-tyrosine phosphorylase [Georgenia satyanarayanai]
MRAPTPTQELLRLGFTDPRRAAGLLDEAVLATPLARAEDAGAPLPAALGRVADPDLALLTLVRLLEAAQDDDGAPDLAAVLASDGGHRQRLLAVLGSSSALGDMLVARPADATLLGDEHADGVLDLTPQDERDRALRAVGADPSDAAPVATVTGTAGVEALRRCYRRRLLEVAAADLTSPDPLGAFPAVAAALSDLAAAALEAALAVARADLPDHGRGARLAVIGMGKAGGRELNYISDVDVVYVVAPGEGAGEDEATAVATRLAGALARNVSGAVGTEPPLWPVDANLRPEGKDGPLVRTVASHVAYYDRWAKTWEFQALLKARPVAGDAALGTEYVAAVEPFVWSAVGRENFVEDAQAMRRRVEDTIPVAEAERQLKLGRGGLRDVEFTVQLLQLVHGRTDEAIRTAGTLDAIARLAETGYIGRDPAERLDECYRYLRVLEHRMQLYRLRRTHVIPSGEADLRRLARALPGDGTRSAETLEQRLRAVRREVRDLHEDIFYRPMLPLIARLSREDAHLRPEAVRERLAAIGYRDPAGAVRHLDSLTAGVSRTAAIQRQVLPAMLGMFARGADPDGGLLAFRKVSEALGTTHWYLQTLRDSGVAAPRLSYLLATSRYVAEGLEALPEAAAWLGEDEALRPRTPEQLAREAAALVRRRPDPADAVRAVRYLRRRELLRGAVGDALDGVRDERDRTVLSVAADQALTTTLEVAVRLAREQRGLAQPPVRFGIIAMGRLGGQEMGYGSDADVLFVHDPVGEDDDVAQEFAVAVAGHVRALLGDPGVELALPVDAALRPEGRNGPMVRSLASYAQYYERWAEPWEQQALLRARPVAGDEGLLERFGALIDPYRYPGDGLDDRALRELRRVKARVESERMPRGVPASRQLKLGRGGLADVEWTAQLLQLQHAGRVPELRTPRTVEALTAARGAGLLGEEDCTLLVTAWTLASRLRAGIALATGRVTGAKVDVLPHDPGQVTAVARLLGYGPGESAELEEDYLRATRRARAVVERIFFG